MGKIFRSKSFMLAAAFVASMMFSTVAAHAQLVGELEANIPFAFSADNTRLPAGEYYIHPADEVDTSILEIESASKHIAVLLMTENNQALQTPKASEMVFDKIGNHYFLREIVVQDSKLEYTLAQSKTEAKIMKGNVKLEKHRLTVKHHKTRVSKP